MSYCPTAWSALGLVPVFCTVLSLPVWLGRWTSELYFEGEIALITHPLMRWGSFSNCEFIDNYHLYIDTAWNQEAKYMVSQIIAALASKGPSANCVYSYWRLGHTGCRSILTAQRALGSLGPSQKLLHGPQSQGPQPTG